MNKNILRSFQFGFEIEGVFDKSLESLSGEFKEDGSVGSNERLRPPSSLVPLMIGDDDGECDSCSGNGTYTQECECDYDIHDCTHEHETACEVRDETDGRLINYDNCIHGDCSDDCYIRPCDQDDNYHESNCEDCDGSGHAGNSGLAQEYASKVNKDFDSILEELGKFVSNKHAWNKTCGLHFHIGIKPGCKPSYKKLWNATADYDFLMNLYKQSIGWCECQRNRMLFNDNHYYAFWKNPYDLAATFNHQYPLRDFNRGSTSEKFRFLRFHTDYNTLEFRFLAPCDHKVENIKKLISYLTDYLGNEQEYSAEGLVTIEPKKVNLTIEKPIRGKRQYVLHNDF